MESAIKIGQQFEFAMHSGEGSRQKAVVTRVLSNREEGLGPEVDFYFVRCCVGENGIPLAKFDIAHPFI